MMLYGVNGNTAQMDPAIPYIASYKFLLTNLKGHAIRDHNDKERKERDMALGSNRDYKTRDIQTRAALSWHDSRTKQLMQSGLMKDDASSQALDDWYSLSIKEKNAIFQAMRDHLNKVKRT